ncbi:CRISPR-associated ring nuclease Csm6 [Vibrio breoganii]|uniref:TIGR02584 family CRISPR-associated protein n=2 Tax=Vibrio breoganii TaxID=553239 RepID=A0ABX1UCH5_9VIBR|nr:TIGR02584 family CRISPR-associated protein [Vibrio breoganii]NMR71485.1 TIGR02584 family CRISPR-associated protein [Vibrio breoganii]
MQHVLLAVSGMTPQIITETLYGIHKKTPQKMPSKVVVMTTSSGEDRLLSALTGENNHLDQFCLDYGYDPISLEIKVPQVGGQKLIDVRTDQEQQIVADFITDHVRQHSKQTDIAIHASLAGGRKTMGFTLGYAMSLFGRPQDCLSHVLVNEPYESVPDFYYPTPTTVLRSDWSKQTRHDLSLAEVTLGEIPLVLMREELPSALIERDSVSYTQTVNRVNEANLLNFDTIAVELDYRDHSITCNGYKVELTLEQFVFYAWIAMDSKEYHIDGVKDGIAPPRKNMSKRELLQRLTEWMLSAFPEHERDKLKALPEDHLLDLIDERYQGDIFLFQRKGAQDLFDIDGLTSQSVVHKKQYSLWVRLLSEVNGAIEGELGSRFGGHYKIQEVNNIKIKELKKPIQTKAPSGRIVGTTNF